MTSPAILSELTYVQTLRIIDSVAPSDSPFPIVKCYAMSFDDKPRLPLLIESLDLSFMEVLTVTISGYLPDLTVTSLATGVFVDPEDIREPVRTQVCGLDLLTAADSLVVDRATVDPKGVESPARFSVEVFIRGVVTSTE